MAKLKIYKCGYKYCFCEQELNSTTPHETYKNKHYHTECFKQKQDKEEIRKLYLENINPNEVVSSLNGVIHNIIHKKNISSDFLLFALKYCISNKKNIKYAAGLHYLVADVNLKKKYDDYILEQKAKEIKENINNNNDNATNYVDFEYKNTKPKWLL